MLHYLTTDPQIMGFVTWGGTIVTVSGIVIAIIQIRKVRSASQATSAAMHEMLSAVRRRENLLELKEALAHLNSAKARLNTESYDAASILVGLLATSLTQARELLSEIPSDRRAISLLIVQVAGVGQEIDRLLRSDFHDPMPLIVQLGRIGQKLDEVIARQRFAYGERP